MHQMCRGEALKKEIKERNVSEIVLEGKLAMLCAVGA
jgi:hypothetical protein